MYRQDSPAAGRKHVQLCRDDKSCGRSAQDCVSRLKPRRPPVQCGLGHAQMSNRILSKRPDPPPDRTLQEPGAASIWPARKSPVICESNHPHLYSLSSRGGRVLPVIHRAGAVGANPPQESLRPMYRCGEATLESSQATSGSPTVQAEDHVRGISQVQYRAGRNPTHAVPLRAGQTWSSS